MKKQLSVKGGLHRGSRRNRPEPLPAAVGILRPQTGALKLPPELEDEAGNSVLPQQVVLVIVLLWLVFIAIITWFVAHMPPRGG